MAPRGVLQPPGRNRRRIPAQGPFGLCRGSVENPEMAGQEIRADRYSTDIVADQMQMLGGRDGGGGDAGGDSGGFSQPPARRARRSNSGRALLPQQHPQAAPQAAWPTWTTTSLLIKRRTSASSTQARRVRAYPMNPNTPGAPQSAPSLKQAPPRCSARNSHCRFPANLSSTTSPGRHQHGPGGRVR